MEARTAKQVLKDDIKALNENFNPDTDRWVYKSVDYTFVKSLPTLGSIRGTMENGVAGPLKSAKSNLVRLVKHDWHWSPKNEAGYQDPNFHFNVELNDMMYHVYTNGTSNSIAFDHKEKDKKKAAKVIPQPAQAHFVAIQPTPTR